MSKSSEIPVPKAVIIFLISSELSILSSLAFSTLSILPLSGSTACVLGSLALMAEPPAELPSTIYISHSVGSLLVQSVSFPGSFVFSSPVFLLTSSLAFLAASLALEAKSPFSNMVFATVGFSSRKYSSFSERTASTAVFASLLPSFVFVCPSNWGSLIFMFKTAVMPSLMSSPERALSESFRRPNLLPYSFTVFVRPLLKPARCVPPSVVFILFTNENIVSLYSSLCWKATST